jgi:hypothetical protein
MRLKITFGFLVIIFNAFAQGDSIGFKLSSYLETYYSFDFNKPSNHQKSDFIYSHNKHNEFNINLAYIKTKYNTSTIRSNLALMAGTYANANLAHEPDLLKHIFEANVGFKLSSKHQLWFDAGVFPSHIGFESAIGKDCKTLTRSMLADNSPYYESGAKLSYQSKNEKWFLSALILNGWQRIQRLPGNNTPAFGHQLTFTPSKKLSINSSSFIGSDAPDSVRQMRYFHNLYAIYQLHSKLDLIAGFDVGLQQKQKNSSEYHQWYSPVLILTYHLHPKIDLASRVEYYSDENQVMITLPYNSQNSEGFKTLGYSLNIDYKVSKQAWFRIEGRYLQSESPVFKYGSNYTNQNYYLTACLAISL